MMLLSKHVDILGKHPAFLIKRYAVTLGRGNILAAGYLSPSKQLCPQNAGPSPLEPTWVKIQRRHILNLYRPQATGFNLPGQGLKKITEEEDKLIEEKSIVLRFINRKIKEQEIGKKTFPLIPDYKFYIQLLIVLGGILLFGWAVFPDIMSYIYIHEEPTENKAVAPEKVDSLKVLLYKSLPLRFISRIVGRIMEVEIESLKVREFFIGLFAKQFGANLEEALVKDLRYYNSIQTFFHRPLDPKCRPINEKSIVTSPADGTVLTFGTVDKGKLEQIKGVTYSLQKFIGPLPFPPVHNHGNKDGFIKNWSAAPLEKYHPALMHDPEKNNLYQCVIYLAPGDYHRFHSPCDWVMKHRRHFPGDLLSVSPKVASWVDNLFIMNERVVLSGTWQHGFFSVTAVGATNVGTIKLYDDLFLKTNRRKFKPGTYYDMEYEDNGFDMKKGQQLGEFNLGSTIVLVFEAPKDFEFKLEVGKKLKYGEALIETN